MLLEQAVMIHKVFEVINTNQTVHENVRGVEIQQGWDKTLTVGQQTSEFTLQRLKNVKI